MEKETLNFKDTKNTEQDYKFNLGDIVKTIKGFTIHHPLEFEKTYTGNLRIVYRFFDGMGYIYVVEVEYGVRIPVCESNLELVAPSESPYVPQDIPENERLLDVETYNALKRLGILDTSVRSYNRGKSNYSKHIIQPWSVWIDYNLNAFDADIVKRILRTKEGEPRRLDYEKIIHICEERIRQLDCE